jgi:hypothetical protein
MNPKIIDGKRRYNVWAGNPKGWAERETDCIEAIYDSEGFGHYFQCSRKRGHGPDGLYCKQHAKKHESNGGQDGKETEKR